MEMTIVIDQSIQLIETQQSLGQWVPMSWAGYENWRDRQTDPQTQRTTLQGYFDRDLFLVRDMGWEGVSHAEIKDLFVLLISLWFMVHSGQKARSFSGGLLEKPGLQAAAPDLLLYVGEGSPRWQPGESRRIDLTRWRRPDLVGEVADTTLASDLDEMKQLYAALEIPEYWVIDIVGRRVLIFELMKGRYVQRSQSQVMQGLTVELLEQALERWAEGEGVEIGNWFMEAIC